MLTIFSLHKMRSLQQGIVEWPTLSHARIQAENGIVLYKITTLAFEIQNGAVTAPVLIHQAAYARHRHSAVCGLQTVTKTYHVA